MSHQPAVHTYTEPGHDTRLDASPIRDGCSDAVWLRTNRRNTLGVKSVLGRRFMILILVQFSTTSKPGMTTIAISSHEWALTHPVNNYCLMSCWTVHFSSVEHGVLSPVLGGGRGLCVYRGSPLNSLPHLCKPKKRNQGCCS